MKTQDDARAEGRHQNTHRRNSKLLATWLAGGMLGFAFGSLVLVGSPASAFGTFFGSGAQTNCADKGLLRRARPANREAVGYAAPRTPSAPRVPTQPASLSGLITAGGLDWRRLDFLDDDDDGEIDAVRIELATGKVLTWRVARQ